MSRAVHGDGPRTLLGLLIRERRWTIDDFRRHYAAAARAVPGGPQLTVSDRQAKRWITGNLTSRPYPAACLVLERMFGYPVESLLAPPLTEATAVPAGTAPRAGTSAWGAARAPAGLSPDIGTDRGPGPGACASMDAEETFRFVARAQDAAAPEILALLWNEVRRLANSYGSQLSLRIDDLVVARRAVFRLLSGPTDPDQVRDLYLLGGLLCAMLAHASRDLCHNDRAQMYQSAALLCAQRSGHPGLTVIVRTEQAATAYWMGRHAESVRFGQLGARAADRVRGSIAALPAAQQARAYAAIGDTARTREALATSRRVRERAEPDDLDEIGGMMRLSLPEHLGIVAGTVAWLPDPLEAEQAAADALAAYQAAPAEDRSHNSEAIARADLALARMRRRSLDGALDALRPVLELPPRHRVLPVRTGVRRLSSALEADPLYRRTAGARDLAAAIDDFTQRHRPLPG